MHACYWFQGHDLEDAVGRHELSVVPRSMFAADGEMLHCHTKSNLMVSLESLPDSTDNNGNLESDHGGELPRFLRRDCSLMGIQRRSWQVTLIADKMLQQAHALGQSVVVTWGTQCRATHTDKRYLDSDQEKADTKLILYAADDTASCATSIIIRSPNSRKKE